MDYTTVPTFKYIIVYVLCALFIIATIVYQSYQDSTKRSTRLRPEYAESFNVNKGINNVAPVGTMSGLSVKDIPKLNVAYMSPEVLKQHNIVAACAASPYDNVRIGDTNIICSHDGLGSLSPENATVTPMAIPEFRYKVHDTQPQLVFLGAGGGPIGSQQEAARMDTSHLRTPFTTAVFSPNCCTPDTLSLSTDHGCLCRV